ncbi:MAG: hypothetical protein KDA80_20285 [Planctomycetaceae bacterium]|nr:hypothetical protein [Planctomycetaceae bacterium]
MLHRTQFGHLGLTFLIACGVISGLLLSQVATVGDGAYVLQIHFASHVGCGVTRASIIPVSHWQAPGELLARWRETAQTEEAVVEQIGAGPISIHVGISIWANFVTGRLLRETQQYKAVIAVLEGKDRRCRVFLAEIPNRNVSRKVVFTDSHLIFELPSD